MGSIHNENVLRFLIIGAGCRGRIYGRAVSGSTGAIVDAVAEPRRFNREDFGNRFIWGDGQPGKHQQFVGWREWLAWEQERRRRSKNNEPDVPPGVHGVFVCTLDHTHHEIMTALAPLNLHILCEKPLATSLSDCLSIYRAFVPPGLEMSGPKAVVSIGHVLRYNPGNIKLRTLLLEDRIIGDIVALEHTEPIGWWHFAHSYVRGNWRKETLPENAGSLLTKSCHDIDFIMWLLSVDPNDGTYHAPSTVYSQGKLSQFQRLRKPKKAGNATNCLSCAAADECIYNAYNIYHDIHLDKGNLGWPLDIVVPDIEEIVQLQGKAAAREQLMSRLKEDYDSDTPTRSVAARTWFGRCVYEADNNVCDTQCVSMGWDGDDVKRPSRIAKTASFHMISSTEKQCERRGRVYGTAGELEYNDRTISIFRFDSGVREDIVLPEMSAEEAQSHGGGDYGLAEKFVAAVQAVEIRGWDVMRAQREYIGATLEEIVRNHGVVFAAEESRQQQRVVHWQQWWNDANRS